MPLSDRSDVGMRSCEPLSEFVIVTCLNSGTPSFSQVISGNGEACCGGKKKKIKKITEICKSVVNCPFPQFKYLKMDVEPNSVARSDHY